MLLDKKANIIGVIFSVLLFIISFFVFNITSKYAIEQNVTKQLYLLNKHTNELAKTKIEKILKYKLEVFTQNLIDSGNLKDLELHNEDLIKLIEYFKSENFIPTIGILLEEKSIFVNENNEQVALDKKVTYDLLAHDKTMFQYEMDGEHYLVLKNTTQTSTGDQITTVCMYMDRFQNNELIMPVYEESSFSVIIDENGNSLFYSTIDEAEVNLLNVYTLLRSFSSKNSEAVNTLKLDIDDHDSGIIVYEK